MVINKLHTLNFSLIILCFLILPSFQTSAQQSQIQSQDSFVNYRPYNDPNASPKFEVRIDKLKDVHFGTIVEIPVTIKSGAFRLGGFDLLIRHDPAILSFQSVEPGPAVFSDSGCAWEYFEYRYGQQGNCGTSACKSGIIRVFSVAETNNGPIHPKCWSFDDEVV